MIDRTTLASLRKHSQWLRRRSYRTIAKQLDELLDMADQALAEAMNAPAAPESPAKKDFQDYYQGYWSEPRSRSTRSADAEKRLAAAEEQLKVAIKFDAAELAGCHPIQPVQIVPPPQKKQVIKQVTDNKITGSKTTFYYA